jgi:uncharacterized protein (TIGR03067 family)
MFAWAIAGSLILGAPSLKDKPATIDLNGEWEISSYLLDGRAAPTDVHIHFDGGIATFTGGPFGDVVGTCTFDLNRTPAELDIRFPDGRGEPMIGIIKREGQGLLLCFASKTRPTKFESPKDSDIGLITLIRAKKR